MGNQLFATLDAEQPDCKAGIQEIEFGRFDHALVEVLVMRWQQVHDITGLQHGYPGFCRVMGNTAVIGQRGKIEELPRPACAHSCKALKCAQILDIDQLPDVSFQIGSHIVFMPGVRIEPAVENGGEGTVKEYLVEILANIFRVLQLAVGQRQQRQQCSSACQALCNA